MGNPFKLHEALRAPGHVEKEIVILGHRRRLDYRAIAQADALSSAIDQAIEVSLHIVIIVLRHDRAEPALKILIHAGSDQVRVVAF
jgi:hypothetical protein